MDKKKCGRPDCGCDRKTRAFGSATWVAVLAAIVVVGAALWFSLKSHAKTAPLLPSAAVWHPEPAFLLRHQIQLKLGAKQLRHIEIVERLWDLKKATFDVRFKTYDTDTNAALVALSTNKQATGEYGKVLNDFDKARASAWSSATSTLSPEQVIELDQLREPAQSPGSNSGG